MKTSKLEKIAKGIAVTGIALTSALVPFNAGLFVGRSIENNSYQPTQMVEITQENIPKEVVDSLYQNFYDGLNVHSIYADCSGFFPGGSVYTLDSLIPLGDHLITSDTNEPSRFSNEITKLDPNRNGEEVAFRIYESLNHDNLPFKLGIRSGTIDGNGNCKEEGKVVYSKENGSYVAFTVSPEKSFEIYKITDTGRDTLFSISELSALADEVRSTIERLNQHQDRASVTNDFYGAKSVTIDLEKVAEGISHIADPSYVQ